MKLFLVDTHDARSPIRVRLEQGTTIATYNPASTVDMALLTAKLIGLDVLQGRVETGLHLPESRVTYKGTTYTIAFMSELVIRQQSPLSNEVADLVGRDWSQPLTMNDLYAELYSRIEAVRSVLFCAITPEPADDSAVIGTFPDTPLPQNQNL